MNPNESNFQPSYPPCNIGDNVSYPHPSMHSVPPFDDAPNNNFHHSLNAFPVIPDDTASMPPNHGQYPSNHQYTEQHRYHCRQNVHRNYNNTNLSTYPHHNAFYENNTVYSHSNASSNSFEPLSNYNYNYKPSCSCRCCQNCCAASVVTHHQSASASVESVPHHLNFNTNHHSIPVHSDRNNPKMLKFAGNGFDFNPFKTPQQQHLVQIQKKVITIHTLRDALKHDVKNTQTALRIAQMVSVLAESKENVEMLKNENNIVNILKYAMNLHFAYPQIQRECQYALTLLNEMNYSPICANSMQSVSGAASITKYESKMNNKENKKKYVNEQCKKEVDGYKCEECGKIYRYICNLRSHSKIHSDDAYVCEFCSKRFGRKANYVEHRRVHTGETPFPCSICNKRFKQRHSWKNHMKKHEKLNGKIGNKTDK